MMQLSGTVLLCIMITSIVKCSKDQLCKNWRFDHVLNRVSYGSFEMEIVRSCAEAEGKIIQRIESCSWDYINYLTSSNEAIRCVVTEEMKSIMVSQTLAKFALIIKTGKDTIFQRLYLLNKTFGHKFRNQIVISDEARGIGDTKIYNGYDRKLYQYAQNRSGLYNWSLPTFKDEDGNRRDAYKLLPGLRFAIESYPSAQWYIVLDDDAYVFVENLIDFFERLNHSQPEVIGWTGAQLDKCGAHDHPTETHYYYGGAGTFLSSAAATKVYAHLDRCMLQYSDCPRGDVIISRCIVDSGIPLAKSVSPKGFAFLEWLQINTQEEVWPSKSLVCSCPLTAHNLRGLEMQRLYEIEKNLLSSGKRVDFGNLFHDIFALNTSIVTVEGLKIFDFGNGYEWSGPFDHTQNSSSWNDCVKSCLEDSNCVSVSWNGWIEKQCFLKNEIGTLRLSQSLQKMAVIIDRYHCVK